jgi:hypothetical protein
VLHLGHQPDPRVAAQVGFRLTHWTKIATTSFGVFGQYRQRITIFANSVRLWILRLVVLNDGNLDFTRQRVLFHPLDVILVSLSLDLRHRYDGGDCF